MWQAIGIGVSALGGISSRRSARKQAQRERRESIADQIEGPSRLRKGAEKAGFNPLTVMGSSMASGFGYTGAGHGGPAPLSSLSMLGGAIQDASAAYTKDDSVEAQILDTRLELEKVRLEQLKAGGAARTVAGSRRVAGTASLGGGVPAAKGNLSPFGILTDVSEYERFEIKDGGAPSEDSAYRMDMPGVGTIYTSRPGLGQRMEDTYGEVLGSVGMLPVITSDAYHNLKGRVYNPREQAWEHGGDTSWWRTRIFNPLDKKAVTKMAKEKYGKKKDKK